MGEPAATTAVVLQPGYLPWLGFFDQMRRADVFVYYDDVQFDKNGWRNRNRVKSTDGRPYWLTVPVRHRGEGRPAINRIGIDRRAPWARKHVGTLRQHYSAAPHREPYLSELERTLSRDWTRLVDLNCEVTRLMAGWLGITTPTVLASELNVEGRRTERLVRICRRLGAGRYLTGDAARGYLEVDRFSSAGIDVAWHAYAHPRYRQLHGAFVTHLSAIDLLLNCGPRSGAILGAADGGAGQQP